MANILGAAIRLLVGVVLVLAISPFAGWGLLGHGIGFYATIAVGMICILFFARTMEKSDRPLPRIEGFMFGSFFILFGHSVLMTADVILIKNLYPDLAPDFAYGATFSRLVLLVPAAFVGSMFPKVVSSGRGSPEQFVFFKRTLLLTLISTTLMAVFISLFARLLPRLLSLEVISDNLVRWMRMFAFITVPVALISVLSRYLLAQQQLRKTICIPVAAVVYVVCSYFIHCGVDGILWTLAATSTGCCLILFALVLADARKVVEK
ncbi:MAG: hypothetical protein JXR40_01490 [Pontiellaceae bacterium]|nr:hypothetical protein [Pontiellaceae bacterium]